MSDHFHMQISPSARLTGSDFPMIEIDHAVCRARVALHGAQVLEWAPADEAEVLYVSPDAIFREGKAIRGGIPICWPWFGAHPSEENAPFHGIARTRPWRLLSAEEDAAGVTLRFEMAEKIWSAEVIIKAGAELEVRLVSKNTNDFPILISGALHIYFGISDIGEVRIAGLEGVDFIDTLGKSGESRQRGAVEFHEEVDSIYESSSSCLLVDDLSGRTILVEKSGSPSTVVWNPWVAKGKAMADLPDEGYRKFCCIEPAIANDRAVIVMPGERHVLSARISVEE